MASDKIKHYVIELKDESDADEENGPRVYDLDFFGHPDVKSDLLDALNSTGWLKAKATEESEEFTNFSIDTWTEDG